MVDIVVSLNALQNQAESLAVAVGFPCCILLWGDMGVGKTTFSKAFIRSLLKDNKTEVPSPTFTLVQTYQTDKGEIWHSDLYRLKSAEEILELGLLEALKTSICLIEWPDRLQNYLPNRRIDVYLSVIDEYHRSLRIEEKI